MSESTFQRLPTFRLEDYFSRWEFAARHHLTASDAQSMSIGELLALGGDDDRDAFDALGLGYVETRGGDPLREAVAATYDACEPQDILMFAGAEEAIFWVMQLAVAPGDHVIVPVPNYQAFEAIPLAAGAEVTGVPLVDTESGWTIDLDDVRRALRPNTRVIGMNFPHNPTGAVLDPARWRELVDLCEERGIRLVSDEVYRGVERDTARRLPQAADLSPTAVSINVMSKAYGLPGLRVGWVASRDHAFLDLLERHKHYTSICNAGPSEFLATVALRAADRIRDRNRDIVAANVPLVDDLFARHADLLSWHPPVGGSVAFARYHGPEGANLFCRELVEQAGVLLLPSEIYCTPLSDVPDRYFRIGVGRRSVPAGLAALDEYLTGR